MAALGTRPWPPTTRAPARPSGQQRRRARRRSGCSSTRTGTRWSSAAPASRPTQSLTAPCCGLPATPSAITPPRSRLAATAPACSNPAGTAAASLPASSPSPTTREHGQQSQGAKNLGEQRSCPATSSPLALPLPGCCRSRLPTGRSSAWRRACSEPGVGAAVYERVINDPSLKRRQPHTLAPPCALRVESLADHPELQAGLLRWKEWAYGAQDPAPFIEFTAKEAGRSGQLPMTLVAIDVAGGVSELWGSARSMTTS